MRAVSIAVDRGGEVLLCSRGIVTGWSVPWLLLKSAGAHGGDSLEGQLDAIDLGLHLRHESKLQFDPPLLPSNRHALLLY